MSEKIPVKQAGSEKVAAPPNRWRRLGAAALVGAALILPVAANASPAHNLKDQAARAAMVDRPQSSRASSTPDHLFQVASTMVTPEENVTLTCDLGCDGNGLTDGNYSADQEIADIKAAGIDGINQRITIENVVDVPGLTTNFSIKNCSPTSPFFKLGPLNEMDNKVQAAGLTYRIDLDSPNLPTIQPRVIKCIAYVLAKNFNGQTTGGPATITHFMFGKEQNDPLTFNGSPNDYATRFEAAAAGFRAGNKLAVVAMGGLRTDGVGTDPGEYLKALAAVDPNMTADEIGVHIYPSKAQKALARQNTKQASDAATAIFVNAVAAARQAINDAWPNRAYVPGAQYTAKTAPFEMEIYESGYQGNSIDPNGVDMATKANLDGRQILSMIKNQYGVVMQAEFHFFDESRNNVTGKPGFQTGFVSGSGRNLDQAPVNRDTPMTRMMPGVMAKVKQARTS